MKIILKVLSSAILIVLLSLFLVFAAYASGVPKEVLDASNSVVYVEVDSAAGISSGSGFIIKNDTNGTFIATNNHVIEGNLNGVSVWTGENEKRTAIVVAHSEEYDIAVIKLSEPLQLKELILSTTADQGDEVFAVGYPAAANSLSEKEAHVSNEATITNGVIGSVRSMKNVDYGPNVKLLQINAEINLGNSGGPLLNDKGQVIGINTYGVINSQGIFGAISASELKTFIENNQIFEVPTVEGTTGWLIFVFIGLAIAVIICLIIFVPRFTNKISIPKLNIKRKTKKGMLLNEYLSRLEEDIDASAAVSLMMPVILYLRNKHNEGSVYLKLSPSRLSVTKDGCIIRESEDIPTDEFIAPEQSTGYAGIKADIYGVCAILRHMLLYRQKGIDAEEQMNLDPVSQGLLKIINKGLSKNPDKRFVSMQELIFELSPFNTGLNEKAFLPFNAMPEPIHTEEPTGGSSKKSAQLKPKRKKRIIIFVTAAAALFICIFLGYSVINYTAAMSHAKSYDFRQAGVEIYNTPFAQALFPNDYTYIGAGADMLNRNYDIAVSRLETLGDYNGAADLIKEVKYRKAAMLADEKSYDDAIQIFKQLGGYKDCADLIIDTTCRKAGYYVSTGEYQTALNIFRELSSNGYTEADFKIQELFYTWGCDLAGKGQYIEAYKRLQYAGSYADAGQILSDLKSAAYNESVDNYHLGKYIQAEEGFTLLNDFLDSSDYLVLTEAHLSSFSFDSTKLWPLIDFEDASELIMFNQECAEKFLIGTWRGNSRYFKMNKNGRISYNIPWIKYGNYYRIENGKVLVYKEKTPQTTKTLFKITVINQKRIKIYSYKNHKTYTLYRQ